MPLNNPSVNTSNVNILNIVVGNTISLGIGMKGMAANKISGNGGNAGNHSYGGGNGGTGGVGGLITTN